MNILRTTELFTLKERVDFMLYEFNACILNRVQHFATPWTVACQAPLSMEFSRQEYWSGLPCPPPGDPPNSGIKSASLAFPALTGKFFTTMPPGKPLIWILYAKFFVKKKRDGPSYRLRTASNSPTIHSNSWERSHYRLNLYFFNYEWDWD